METQHSSFETTPDNSISSDFKLGIIGGGQLGKMLCQVTNSWDIQTHIIDPDPNAPASHLCTHFVNGDYKSYDEVYRFGKEMDLITIEIEHINTDALIQLKKEGVEVHPDPEMLKIIQDKGLQKMFYRSKGLPTSDFKLFENEVEVSMAVESGKQALPFVQKTRTAGYDGKGIFVAGDQNDLSRLLPGPSLIEEKVDILKEIAVIVAKNKNGEVSAFPPVEMEFNPEANLVEFLFCPADLSETQQKEASELAVRVIEAYDICGIMAVEMFLDKSGNLMVNEVAPRPHNSGHHTIESHFTSQYEQLLRAILNFPLGNTDYFVPSVMLNVLGHSDHSGPVRYEGIEACMAVSGANLHIYGKKITKPFRKMGHVTILDPDLEKAKEKARYIQSVIKVKS